MTLLEQLEHELDRVQKQLQRLSRERTVLTEQITRLRTGASPEVVYAALQVAFGVPLNLYLLSNNGDDDMSGALAERLSFQVDKGGERDARARSPHRVRVLH